MVGVEHTLGRLQIPQPTGTGARTACQLSSPLRFTIDIEGSITIAIRIDSLSRRLRYTIQTIFLIKAFTSSELKPVGLAHLIRHTKEVSAIQVNIILYIIGDKDMFSRSKFGKTA